MASSEQNESAKKQIRNLLLVIFSGAFCAFLAAAIGLYFYGPGGRYLVKNTLLSPSILETLSYNDLNTKTGNKSRFVFDKIEFSYYETDKKHWQKVRVSPNVYQRFYQSVINEKSLIDVPENVISQFTKANPSSLVLTVRTESNAAWQELIRVFQEIQFANDGDYFRIELREQNSPESKWAYFYHPHIYREVLNLFISSAH